ncbi:hypothetical protein PVMG_05782 [Plasmodium vivax Mauritania I]|uniref:Uncharacterized protein n=1 Tax=Plasmodium vivax Mauritania I TaxID=1035515 RepID=A0A0J9TIX0_PLAVI|nr:hypothetical protein PVMG_05782 [Plasmodium vivax Mauritania I]
MDSINEISPPHEAPHVGLFPKRPQLQLKGQEYVQPPEFSNDVAKDSSTILSSITGFINEFEPAPILGVSGGMGALFLLFKEDLQDMMIFMKDVLDQVQLIYLIGLNWNNILYHQSMSIDKNITIIKTKIMHSVTTFKQFKLISPLNIYFLRNKSKYHIIFYIKLIQCYHIYSYNVRKNALK